MVTTHAQYHDIETQGRMTITLAAAQLYAQGISLNTSVEIAFQIFDRVVAVQDLREQMANAEVK